MVTASDLNYFNYLLCTDEHQVQQCFTSGQLVQYFEQKANVKGLQESPGSLAAHCFLSADIQVVEITQQDKTCKHGTTADEAMTCRQAFLDQMACGRPRPRPPAVFYWSHLNPQALILFLTVSQRKHLAIYPPFNTEGKSPMPRILSIHLHNIVHLTGFVNDVW